MPFFAEMFAHRRKYLQFPEYCAKMRTKQKTITAVRVLVTPKQRTQGITNITCAQGKTSIMAGTV